MHPHPSLRRPDVMMLHNSDIPKDVCAELHNMRLDEAAHSSHVIAVSVFPTESILTLNGTPPCKD